MTELKPCPFCGLVNEHKPSCFFTLEKVARAYPPDAFVDAGGPEALEDAWDTRATDAELERLRADLARVTAERDRLRTDLIAIQAAAEGISRTVNDSVGERLWAVKQIARAALNGEGDHG